MWSLGGKATLSAGSFVRHGSGSEIWVDPIIGISGRVELGSGICWAVLGGDSAGTFLTVQHLLGG